MAMNPMQRRARNSFLAGFLVALIVMALVVLLLLNEMRKLKEAKELIESRQISVFVTKNDLKSGQEITLEEDFINSVVQTTISREEIINSDDFEFINENGEIIPKYNTDGSEMKKRLAMKIDVPAGTIVTKEMFTEVEEQVQDSQRTQEYNMISLPTKLKNGDYIDIRLAMPSGQDFIVLSKKKVIGTTEESIWLNVTEEEILTMNNAIVEAYTAKGTKLYAIPYVEAGLQEKAIPTYYVSEAVLNLFDKDPNISEKAKNELYKRYTENIEIRTNYIEPVIQQNITGQNAAVETGYQEEIQKIKEGRKEFIESLEGEEGVIGYER